MDDMFDEDVDFGDMDFFNNICEPPAAKKQKRDTSVGNCTLLRKRANEPEWENSPADEAVHHRRSTAHLLKLVALQNCEPSSEPMVHCSALPKSYELKSDCQKHLRLARALPDSKATGNSSVVGTHHDGFDIFDDAGDIDWDLGFDVNQESSVACQSEKKDSSASLISGTTESIVRIGAANAGSNGNNDAENHDSEVNKVQFRTENESVTAPYHGLSGNIASKSFRVTSASSNDTLPNMKHNAAVSKSNATSNGCVHEPEKLVIPLKLNGVPYDKNQEDILTFSDSQISVEELFDNVWSALMDACKLDRCCLSSLQAYTISWMTRKARLKLIPNNRIPFLIVRIKRITVLNSDANAVLMDMTGEIGGTVHSQVMDECCLVAGSFLVLQNVAFVSPSATKFHLLITARNVLCCFNIERNDMNLLKLFSGELGSHLQHLVNNLPRQFKQQNEDEWKELLQQMDDDMDEFQ